MVTEGQHSNYQNLSAAMLPAMQRINPKHWTEKHEDGKEVQMAFKSQVCLFLKLSLTSFGWSRAVQF